MSSSDLIPLSSAGAGGARPSGGVHAWFRWAWVACLAGLTTLLLANHVAVRSAEAKLLAFWAGPMFPRGFMADGPAFLIVGTPQGSILFNITVECTVLVLIVPMMILLGLLGLHRGTRPGRLLVALTTATVLMICVNQLRLWLIGWATYLWGLDPGYTITHVFLGSVLALVGFGASALIALKILGVGASLRKAQH